MGAEWSEFAESRGVQIDGAPFDDARIDEWNQRIAERLSRAGQNNAKSTLQEVRISETDVTMVWRVETQRSGRDRTKDRRTLGRVQEPCSRAYGSTALTL